MTGKPVRLDAATLEFTVELVDGQPALVLLDDAGTRVEVCWPAGSTRELIVRGIGDWSLSLTWRQCDVPWRSDGEWTAE